MSVFFSPNGTLDIASDAADLPQELAGAKITSAAMQRCKNMRLDRNGVAVTRFGSSKFNSTAIATNISKIIEQAGNRFALGTSIYEDESRLASGFANAQWSAILYNSYNSTVQNVFALNGEDRKRIEGSNVYEWGITAPTAAAVTDVGSLAGLTGDYSVRYTYCRKEGTTVICESDPSDASDTTTLSNGSLDVTFTASSDSQVTHVRVYRTLSGGSIYYHDQDIAIGTLTVDTDTADGSLGSEVSIDHDRPPLGTHVIGPVYNGTCFIIKNNLLYYSSAKQPEYWPVNQYIEMGPPQRPGKCGVIFNGQVYYLDATDIYFVQGTGINTFFPVPTNAQTGTQSKNGAIAVEGRGIYHVGSDGVYLFNGQTDPNITDQYFFPIFHGQTVNGVPAAKSDLSKTWLIRFKNRVYFGYPGTADTYPSNCLVLNLSNDRWSYYSWGVEIRAVGVDETNNRLLGVDVGGHVWELEKDSVTDDGGAAISWEIESKDFTLQTRKHFPRWVKYDVDASDVNCSATGSVILDGAVHQTHTIIGDRVIKRRLIETGNGNRESIRISGSGLVEIYAVEAE